MTERTTSQMVGATLLGGLIGAGLALLFAPRSGRETREHLQQNASSALSRGKDKVTEVAHQTGKKVLHNNRSDRRPAPVLSAWEEEV